MSERVSDPGLLERVAAIRQFNRFYTRQIGVLREKLLDTRFNLAESRVLYELAHRSGATSTDLAEALDLDAGYLSRILQRFERDGLVQRTPSEADRRRVFLSLTAAGAAAFAPLDQRARDQVAQIVHRLPEPAQAELIGAMRRIEVLLGDASVRPYVIRSHRPGDIGWVIARHGAVYAAEYAFGPQFEALVAQVAGAFLIQHDPACEHCWIAEREGVKLGSIFLVRASDQLAKLRLLLVEPAARGEGIGRELVAQYLAFARAAGYQRVTLWTQDVLTTARRIYRDAGFRLVSSKPHRDFGPPVVGEDWELELRPGGSA
jgi:DNA-binding MarR family transcriptional regulator/N-acetylglutamate synthase-like GNAT family acetyltransferase